MAQGHDSELIVLVRSRRHCRRRSTFRSSTHCKDGRTLLAGTIFVTGSIFVTYWKTGEPLLLGCAPAGLVDPPLPPGRAVQLHLEVRGPDSGVITANLCGSSTTPLLLVPCATGIGLPWPTKSASGMVRVGTLNAAL